MAVLPSLDNLRALLQRVIFVPIIYALISLLPIFLTGWENSDRMADRLFATVRSKENMFDFIVVGGGTAGALVANRLAEHYKVLLLEAGGTPMPLQTIPALALKFLNHPQTDWSHKTVPQRRACLNSINQQSSWSSGRGLGGTTNINFMTHVRGHPMDFENWAEITGDASWGWSGVLPYFKRSETFSGTSGDPEARGHDGELRIRTPSYVGLSEDWIRAGQEIGYPFVDLNGRHEEGFGILQYPIFKGIRQSTYAAFLLPMHKSPRLVIRRYALVRKVLFRDMNNMAYGVEYVRHGRIETAIATKEVILSAGTLGSAKLLMLSGVGPRQHLEELGIPVRSELPVGSNLQDHLGVHLGPFFIAEPKSFLFDRDVSPENIVRWLFLGTGPITTTGYQGAASICSSIAKSQGQGNWPDIHLILHGQAIHQGYTDAFAYAYGLQEDELMQYYQNAIGRDSFHIYVVGARPTSTGKVLLGGASINDPLVINPKYLEDGGNGDFIVLMEGVRTALNIANTSMFQRLGTEFTKAKLPGCQEFELGTDSYWECYVRRFTLTMHNPVGTVTMGSVVDPGLKVRGTRGLRVVDASVQPTLVSTGTAASTLMIAEKGVDMILKDHGIPDRDQDLFDVIFGRNGFFKRNPILRILQREFDTLNPLRALFKPFITATSAESLENEAKERFTRNGKLDNPFLQIISTVFGGNAHLAARGGGREDVNLASASSKLNFAVGPVVEGGAGGGGGGRRSGNERGVLQRRHATSAEEDRNKNVIGKNEWVLQQPTVKQSNLGASTGFKITLGGGQPKKGGKRYQLLQKILKEEELDKAVVKLKLNLGPNRIPSTIPPAFVPQPPTTAETPPPTTPKITTAVPPPAVQVVQFQSPVNSTENEIIQDPYPENQKAITLKKDLPGPVIAKPISVNTPSSFGLIPVAPPTTPSPLNQLLNSLSTFEQFMNALTGSGKHKRPPPPPLSQVTPATPRDASGPNLFTLSQSQNIFSTNGGSNNNGNIFNFLSPSGNKLGGGGGTTTGPFHFLFGITSPSTTTPPPTPGNELADAVGGVQSHPPSTPPPPEQTNFTRNDRSQTNFFSNWFKPPPSQGPNSGSSNWFKPFSLNDKPTDKSSSSSWFKPLADLGQKSSTWFKPLTFGGATNDINERSSSPAPILTSSPTPAPTWFKPWNFNSLSTTPSPPSKDIFGDLFDLFLGGLKKHERRAVFKTMGTLLEAGETLADLFGAPGNGDSTKALIGIHPNHDQMTNFFEQISKGRKRNSENGKDEEIDDSLLKSLIALNEVLSSHSSTTAAAATTSKISTVSPEVEASIENLEKFLSTFDYPRPSSSTTATNVVTASTTTTTTTAATKSTTTTELSEIDTEIPTTTTLPETEENT